MTAVYFNNNKTLFYYNSSALIKNSNGYNLFLNDSSCVYNNRIDCQSAFNDSLLPDTGFREAVERSIHDNPFVVLEIVGLCCLILATIFGNALVVVSVFKSCCQCCHQENIYRTPPSHYLIASIAGADLLLGLFVLPLSCAREIAKEWYMGETLCTFWTTLDVLSCTASIISLCAVAVDRYIGVSRPLRYVRLMTKNKTKLLILGIWIVSLLIAVGPPLGWTDQDKDGPVGGHFIPRSFHRHHTGADCHVNKQLSYVIFSATGSFYIPACIVIVLYWLIYRVAKKHAEAIRKGQCITGSNTTLRVHKGRSSGSDTQSMNSMSSSLNLSSTNDASTPLTHVPRPTTTIRIENEPANNNPVYTNCQPTPSPIRQRLTSVNTPVKCVTSPQGNHLMPLAPPAPAKRRNADQIQEASSIRSFKEKYFPAFVKEAKYKKQERAAKTLGIVVGAFLLCWSPFFLLLPVEAACPDCDLKTIFNIAFWLGYINSCLNPLIYVCSSRELRKSFQNVLCFRKKSANNVV